MSNKKLAGNQIAIRADDTLLAMIDALKTAQAYKSRAAVMEQAIREMYNSKFPAYKGVRPAITATTGMSAPMVRSMERQVLRKEEGDRLREYGKHVCTSFYIKGTPVGENTNEPENARCDYKIVKGLRLKDAFTEVRFGDIPMGTGNWAEDIVLRRYVLQQTFPDFKFEELDEEKAKANFTKQVDLLLTGIERGEIKQKDIPAELFSALAQEARDRHVDDTLVDKVLALAE